ncbi:hypothetical protein MJT46_001428 [Ovis ammon polii x Ovis aries]|nr:hypothetical protein MJT46_001428 [Ovis ammon polii x Ovis aries]
MASSVYLAGSEMWKSFKKTTVFMTIKKVTVERKPWPFSGMDRIWNNMDMADEHPEEESFEKATVRGKAMKNKLLRGPGITYRNATLLCPTVGPDNTTPQPQKSLPQNGSSLEMPYDGRVRLSKTKKQASPVYPASGTWMLVKFMSNNKIIDNQMNYAGHSGDKESVPLLSLNFVLQSASKQYLHETLLTSGFCQKQGIWAEFATYQKNLTKINDQSLPSRPAARDGESILVHWQTEQRLEEIIQ